MNEMWPSLPLWFWPAAGVWELSFVALLWKDLPQYAIPMANAFMGGVFCSAYLKDAAGNTCITKIGPHFLLGVSV